MFFKDIAGKQEVKDRLIQSVSKNRIPHAQIFLGKEGFGALPLALAFASYIMCENKSSLDSCGQCNHCLKSHKWVHPDIHFSYPVVKYGDKKRADTTSDDFLPKWRAILDEQPTMNISSWLEHIEAENNQANINVKECNDIMQKLNMMSYESDYKVLVMWLPEYLGIEGNRLLKLIEEPTDNTYIILVTENQDLILPTIRSRCQLVTVPAYESHEISAYLEKTLSMPNESAQQIANLVEGNLHQAIVIGKNEVADYSDLLISWFRVAYKSDPVEINQWLNEVSMLSKEEQKNFLFYGLHFLRQFNVFQLQIPFQVNLTPKEKETAQKMSAIIDPVKTEFIVTLISEAIENLHRNINIKILLFSDTLKIGEVIRKK